MSLEALLNFVLTRLHIVDNTIEYEALCGNIDELETRLHEIPPHIRYRMDMIYAHVEIIKLVARIVPISFKTFSGTPRRLCEILHMLSLLSKPSILVSYMDVAKRNISPEEYTNIVDVELIKLKCK